MSRPVAPDSSSGWPGSRLTIESFSWSPDGQALVITARERDVPWVYLWFAGQWETKPASVHVAASGNISHRYDPEFDAIFGPSGWGLGNPRFEGSTLVAEWCASATTAARDCRHIKSAAVRTGSSTR